MIRLTLTQRGAWLLGLPGSPDVDVIELSDTLWHACATVYAVRTSPLDAGRRADPLREAYAALWKSEHGWKLHSALRRVAYAREVCPEKASRTERAIAAVAARELFVRKVLRRIEACRAADRYAEMLALRCRDRGALQPARAAAPPPARKQEARALTLIRSIAPAWRTA